MSKKQSTSIKKPRIHLPKLDMAKNRKAKPKNQKKVSLKVRRVKTSKPKNKQVKIAQKRTAPAKPPENRSNKEDMAPIQNNQDEYIIIERQKRIIMWSGVSFFMVLIAFFWLYNTKQLFQQSSAKSDKDFSLTQWGEMTDEISEKMNQMKENLQEIKDFNNEDPVQLPVSATGTEPEKQQIETDHKTISTTSPQITREEIDELKKKLEEMEERLIDN